MHSVLRKFTTVLDLLMRECSHYYFRQLYWLTNVTGLLRCHSTPYSALPQWCTNMIVGGVRGHARTDEVKEVLFEATRALVTLDRVSATRRRFLA